MYVFFPFTARFKGEVASPPAEGCEESNSWSSLSSSEMRGGVVRDGLGGRIDLDLDLDLDDFP